MRPLNYKIRDCITGLIGMSCLYVKQIKMPNEGEFVECKWADCTMLIDNIRIYVPSTLGISMCPGTNTYFDY